jgi:hypothetical protein
MDSNLDPFATARLIIDDRVREAQHRSMVSELRRSERPEPARAASRPPERHSRLWTLVHLRHAYS